MGTYLGYYGSPEMFTSHIIMGESKAISFVICHIKYKIVSSVTYWQVAITVIIILRIVKSAEPSHPKALDKDHDC